MEFKMEPQNAGILKPLDYIKIVFKRKWLLIIPSVIGLLGGIIAINLLPKMYQSSTLILVEEGRIINPLITGLVVSSSTAQRLNILREQMLGWDRMLQLIEKLKLAKSVKSQLEFESLVKTLRGNIKVRLFGNSIIGISYEGKNAEAVHNIVKSTADIFIAENKRQQNKETEDAVAFINDQVELYEKKLKQTDIAGMEDQLNGLLIDSTEKHPLVLELRKKIMSAKKELEEGNYAVDPTVVAGSDNELKLLREELKTIREGAANPTPGAAGNRVKTGASNEKLYKLLLLEKADKVQARDSGVNQKLYNELLSRLETAKITQRLEASKEGTRYTILDPARLPLKPVKPNKILTLMMGLFFGAGVGVGLILLAELFDHSFLGVDEARVFLQLPILGATSKLITLEDIRLQKLRNARMAGASLVTSLILAVIIIFNVFLGN